MGQLILTLPDYNSHIKVNPSNHICLEPKKIIWVKKTWVHTLDRPSSRHIALYGKKKGLLGSPCSVFIFGALRIKLVPVMESCITLTLAMMS
jgi:hypothetical protein